MDRQNDKHRLTVPYTYNADTHFYAKLTPRRAAHTTSSPCCCDCTDADTQQKLSSHLDYLVPLMQQNVREAHRNFIISLSPRLLLLSSWLLSIRPLILQFLVITPLLLGWRRHAAGSHFRKHVGQSLLQPGNFGRGPLWPRCP